MIFRPELAQLILDGKKTATRRRTSDNPRSPWSSERCGYKLGQRFAINPGRGVARVGDVTATCVYPQPLRLMQEEDAHKEGFESLEDFKAAWKAINGTFDPREWVWVVEFELWHRYLVCIATPSVDKHPADTATEVREIVETKTRSRSQKHRLSYWIIDQANGDRRLTLEECEAAA